MFNSRVLSTGSFLPEKILTNLDLEKMVETSDQWIRERTGISTRHIAGPNEVTSDLALKAAQSALQAGDLTEADIDAIIFATVTPDQVMPSAACMLQTKLKARNVMAFDLSAACSGFVYGLHIADKFIRAGAYKNVLVVGAETLSRIVSYKDRTTCILFGDGAGAFIVSRTEGPQSLLGFSMSANGSYGDLLTLPAGGSRLPASQTTLDEGLHHVHMKGQDLFKVAVRTLVQGSKDALEQAGLTVNDIDWFVPHQANRRIMEAVCDLLRYPVEKVIANIDRAANTSSASIPIAFDEAVRDGRVQRGQKILFSAFGGGLTSGAVVFEF